MRWIFLIYLPVTVMLNEMVLGAQGLPEYVCKSAEGEIVIDGMLNEKAWQDIEALTQFQAWDGTRKANQDTGVKFLRDTDNLFIGFVAYDKDIWATKSKRDDALCEDEVVEFFIDAEGDSNSYIELEINALNAIFDLYISRTKGQYARCNLKGLESVVYINGTMDNRKDKDEWWSCEIKIPFYNFVMARHIPPNKGDTWRLNAYRIERQKSGDEYTVWSPTYTKTPNFHMPERFGRLVFE